MSRPGDLGRMKQTLLGILGFLALASTMEAGNIIQLRVEPEHKVIVAGSSHEAIVRIDLTASDDQRKRRRTPFNLAVVIDRSGSMQGAKIEKARQAASELIDHLSSDDIVSVVAYSAGAQVVAGAGPARDKERLKHLIERITTSGGTALFAGVELGADEVQKNFSSQRINRVILLSDGLANIGPSSPQDLRRLGNRLAEAGISVTTIGLGDDFNEQLMSGLAEASDANYYYVKDTEKLPEIFARELGSLAQVVARRIKIEITCPPSVEPIGFVGRPEIFRDRKAVVQLDSLGAGQSRYLLLRCRLDGSDRNREVAAVKASYVDETGDAPFERSCAAAASVTFSADALAARSSVNREITVQHELMLNAIRKEEAIAAADAGKYSGAAATLNAQADRLEFQCSAAPANQRGTLAAEVINLRRQSDDLLAHRYGLGNRKELQQQSWSTRNAK